MCVFQGVGIKVMNDANKRHFDEKTLKIQVLNDRFRRTFTGGQVLMTSGVSSLPKPKLITLMNLVRTFDEFNGDNDPYGEHDFGKIDFQGESYFWKIDYYDAELTYGSPDPTDETVTNRVLSIMLAEEY